MLLTPPNGDAEPRASEEDELIVIGRVKDAWGLNGALRVRATPGDPDRIAPGANLMLDGASVRVSDVRWSGRDAIITLDGVGTRDEAENLRGGELQALASSLPALEEGEYYHYQLLDMAVWSSEGEHLGAVTDILVTGSNDVLVVQQSGQPGEILIPAVKQVVLDVDLAEKRMTVELWEGMR